MPTDPRRRRTGVTHLLRLPVLFLLAGPLTLGLRPAQAQQARHPLDPLTWDEHWIVLDALDAAGHLTDSTSFSLVTLQPPEKELVRGWRPGAPIPRAAFAIVREGRSTFEAVIDLQAEAVREWRQVAGVQPNSLEAEYGRAAEIALESAEFREALARRGIPLYAVECFGAPLGYFGTAEEQGRRIATVECTDVRVSRNAFGRGIGGLLARVDLHTGEVIEVQDDGVVPVAESDNAFDLAAIKTREIGAPIAIEQSLGPGFELEGHRVRWQKWSFHFRNDPRVGLVVADVRYADGGRDRSVLYEGHLSEIFVPYMDPAAPYYAFNFLDAGEFNAGGLAHPMQPGTDCPENAVLFDMILAGDEGTPRVKPNVTCLFERYAGDVAWRKRSDTHMESRPRRDLVLRMMSVLGNYDYIFDWVFRQDGTIEIVAAATGIDATKAVTQRLAGKPAGELDGSETRLASADVSAAGPVDSAFGEAAAADAYGRFIAPNLVGVNHDHFFSFRLDLDVDGPANSLEVDRLVRQRLPDDHPRRSLWVVEPQIARTEAEAMLRINLERPALWRVVNRAESNYVGYPTSYQIVPGSNAVSLLDPDDYPQMRAGFTDHHLWVTPYRAEERYAAGMYPVLSEPGRGLPEWTATDRPIVDTDIVVWYTVGFHHVPRAEDWPVMPTAAKSFELRPYDFFDRNPALDLPARP